MSDTNKIKQETLIEHDALGDAIEEWAEEIDLDEFPVDMQDMFTDIFSDGWSMCLHYTMAPAKDLAMLFLQTVRIAKQQKQDKIYLEGSALEAIEALCHRVVGQPEDWQLDEGVEVIRVYSDSNPRDRN